MALSQSLQQKLLQKLSPQQIQLMKLLQVPTAHLEERIKEELEENPALEQGEEDHDEDFDSDLTGEAENFSEDGDKEELDGSQDEYENIDISEYVSDGDDDIADYRTRDDNYPELDEQKTLPHKVETSFHESLLDQLGMLSLDEKNYKIAEQVV